MFFICRNVIPTHIDSQVTPWEIRRQSLDVSPEDTEERA